MERFSKRAGYFLGVVCIIALALGNPSVTPVAHAATFTVNNAGDAGDANPGNGICATSGGVCTLRAAIEENNAGAGGNIITFSAAMTITVGSELLVNKSVTINGLGEANTHVTGNNATRVLNFFCRSGPHNLAGMTIRNGNYVYAGAFPKLNGGGGIFNEGALTLTNVTVSGNRANQGGGIFNEYAAVCNASSQPSLTLNSVTLSSNNATSASQGEGGGGLFNGGALTANGLTISGNSAGYQGGGIYINSFYAVNLTNFTISGNSAKMGGGVSNEIDQLVGLNAGTISGNVSNCCDVGGQPSGGGGIVNNDGAISLTNVTVSGNSAAATGGYGGGIVNIQQMTLSNVTVSGNSATYGSGIYNGASVSNGMTLTNVTVSGNSGIGNSGGGGLWNTTNGHVAIINATFTLNSVTQGGGGIYNLTSGTSVNIRNSIVSGNISTAPWPPECVGAITSSGYNVFGDTTGCTFVASAGDATGTSANLGALKNNGGSTFTHMLLPSSPAIDRVATGCPPPSTDQRGIARPQNSRCDSGAVEFRPGIDYIPLPGVPIGLPLILKNAP